MKRIQCSTLFAAAAAAVLAACGSDRARPTAPNALVTQPGAATVLLDLVPDAAPGNATVRGACLSFHAKAWADQQKTTWLKDNLVDWFMWDGNFAIAYDGTAQKVTTRHKSGDAVLVCGINDGFGQIGAKSYPENTQSNPFRFEVEVGIGTQTVKIDGPASIQDNDAPWQFYATAIDRWGTQRDRTSKATWTTSDANLATINSAGLLTPRHSGSVTVTGTVSGVPGTKTLTILGVTRVDVSPAAPALHPPSSVALTATAFNQDGRAFAGKTAIWTNSDPNVATLTVTGAMTASVKAVATGQTTIRAWVDGIAGLSTVTVTPAPPSVSISGPQTVMLHESALYNANVAGGASPYHYQWRSRQCADVGGSNCGTWSPYNAIGDGYDRPYSYASINACGLRRNELQVLVTDANGSVGQSAAYVIQISNPC